MMLLRAAVILALLTGGAQAQMWPFPGPGTAGAAPSTTTWNPADKSAKVTLSGGNLVATANAGGDGGARSISSTSTAKVYWEVTINLRNSAAGNFAVAGAANSSWALTFIGATGSCGNNSVGGGTTGDVIGVALDATARKIWYRINGGSWLPSGDPATGTGGTSCSGVTGAMFAAFQFNTTGDQATTNFGATAYANTPPSGYGNW